MGKHFKIQCFNAHYSPYTAYLSSATALRALLAPGRDYLSIPVPMLQEVPQSLPQHQMPGVPGDLIPPGVPPQVPTSADSDAPGVDPQMLVPKVIAQPQ